MKNTFEFAKTFFWLVAFSALVATTSRAKTKPDCCGSGEEIYTPSTQRIKIIHSPELNKQLATLKTKPIELAKMRKAIGVANKLIQGHVNNDLYQYGWEAYPKMSAPLEVGWQQHFGPLVSVSLREFRSFNEKRSTAEGIRSGVYITSPRYPHLLCPYSQLDAIQASGDKLYLTYRFVHIARPNTTASHMLDRSELDISRNGKIQTKTIALNADFKLLPYEKSDSSSWGTWPLDIKIYKRDLRGREQGDGSFEKDKPNLRKLLAQITDAEKICNKSHPFQ